MTILQKRIMYLIAGILGGLLAFSAVEAVLILGAGSYMASNMLQGLALGGAFGFMIGSVDGFLYGSAVPSADSAHRRPGSLRYVFRALAAAIAGAGGGVLAVLLSAQMLLLAGIAPGGLPELRTVLPLALIRGAGWLVPGALVGIIDGLMKRSPVRAAAGALGGAVGGMAGGVVLETMTLLLSGNAWAKISGFALFGMSVGLFLGLFEWRFAFARIRILSGAARDREYLLSDRRTRLGSGASDAVDLAAYAGVETSHCAILRRGPDMILESPDGSGVRVNDADAAPRHMLKYGDVIRVGSAKLLVRTL
jgi:hypothetical protein